MIKGLRKKIQEGTLHNYGINCRPQEKMAPLRHISQIVVTCKSLKKYYLSGVNPISKFLLTTCFQNIQSVQVRWGRVNDATCA